MIEMSNVTKTYLRDGAQALTVLDRVSLRVEPGEFLAVQGPSGSGKSTLLHILGCLDKPSAGFYRFLNQDVGKLTDLELSRVRALKIGFVFQSFNLLPATTAVENVEVPMIYGSGAVDRRKALALLARVGLEDRAHHFGPELSGGQQQRVAIARALVNDPALILADEPTGNLDSVAGAEVLDILDALHGEGRTVLVVTHDNAIARRAQRRIVLKDGAIAAEQPARSSEARERRPS
jgi:ABC-type lipoprotein export system ATPase subunit